MQDFFVDRIEDDVVICEDVNGDEVRINRRDIEGKVREGDVVSKDEVGNIRVNDEATEKRRKEILGLKKYIYETKNRKVD